MKKIVLIPTIIIFATAGLYAQTDNTTQTNNVNATITTVGPQSGNATLLDIQEAMNKIKEKEQELVAREQDLRAREDRLKAVEADLISREDEIKKIRDEVSANMNTLNAQDEKDIAQLAKIYSSAKAKNAAAIIVKMDIDKAAALMKKMTAMTAGKIMTEMGKIDPDFASKLSMRLAGDR